MDESKVAVLRHYASPYYDPQKAHEYYMRTRELKGRSTTSLNDDGKKIWSYTKNNIKSEKAAKVKEEQQKLISIPHTSKRIRTNSIRFSQSIRKSRDHRKNLQLRQKRSRTRYRTISENRGGKNQNEV